MDTNFILVDLGWHHQPSVWIEDRGATLLHGATKVTKLILLEPVYTKRQHQHCDNSAVMLQNGFATHFQASPLISMRAESLASSQSCRSVDADAWCKRALTTKTDHP